jgi:hypothetical protein
MIGAHFLPAAFRGKCPFFLSFYGCPFLVVNWFTEGKELSQQSGHWQTWDTATCHKLKFVYHQDDYICNFELRTQYYVVRRKENIW